MNKYRICYRPKATSEEAYDYEEWTEEFLGVPYIKADTMDEALAFAKWYSKELVYVVDEYEWGVFEYEGE